MDSGIWIMVLTFMHPASNAQQRWRTDLDRLDGVVEETKIIRQKLMDGRTV